MKLVGRYANANEVKMELLTVCPFCYNESNSNISVEMYIDGLVEVTVIFGTGKGWDTLEEDLTRETEFSWMWTDITMGYYPEEVA